jgi:predicted nucleotidyltransferase
MSTLLPGFTVLSAEQASVARTVLAEEAAQRDHVVVYLSGAHAYGFPSPDSDLDLKAIHLARTESLLGLRPPTLTHDRMGFVQGVEIDYTSNELGLALAGILKGNGNFLERVLGTCTLLTSPLHEELVPLVQRSLSRRVHAHYRGFATSQQRSLIGSPTVKKLLYVLRTTLTGTHLLRSGQLVTDVTQLLDEYGFAEARQLVSAKLRGERTLLTEAERDRWQASLARAFAALDAAEQASVLPPEPAPTDVAALEHWLIATRRARL